MTELYRRRLLELGHGSYDVAEEILAPELTGQWPDREVDGREALVELIRGTHEMFETLEFRVELGPLVDGDLVAARWRRPDRRRRDAAARHDILRVADGRFAEYWVAS